MTDVETALSDLKRRGSVSLVVGTVPDDAYDRVSRRLLGAPDGAPSRRRLLVVPASRREQADDRLRASGPADRSHARVVSCNGTSRSVAAAGAADGRIPVRHVDGTLEDVGVAVTESLDRFEAAAGGLSPAELRVGVDHLSQFGAYDTPPVFGFFHVLARQVRRVDGMGHVRLPRARDDETVRRLAPLFDALLELRLDGHRLEQRWHLREANVVSDWHAPPEFADGR